MSLYYMLCPRCAPYTPNPPKGCPICKDTVSVAINSRRRKMTNTYKRVIRHLLLGGRVGYRHGSGRGFASIGSAVSFTVYASTLQDMARFCILECVQKGQDLEYRLSEWARSVE